MPKPMPRLLFFVILFLLAAIPAQAQQALHARVADAGTSEGLPFATVRLGDTRQGMVTNLNGYFTIPQESMPGYIEVSYIGYKTLRIMPAVGADTVRIMLEPDGASLSEVVVEPPYDKIRSILNRAIANRDRNNPDKYDWYRCHVYYKMVADASQVDTSGKEDTSAGSLASFLEQQHLLMTETYSIRTWKKPQQLQEQVLASRFSGFKKSLLTGLITDVLPFHAYNDYLALNGKDYHNPVSKGYGARYEFNLSDEFMTGTDTVWILSFRDRNNTEGLKGQVYINSDGYAIAHLIAASTDDHLKRTVRIEQQYKKDAGKWFPDQLNYIIDWKQQSDGAINIFMKGTSLIDSVSFQEERFRFDRMHTVRLEPNADERTDAEWLGIRPQELSGKEARTYTFNDSIMAATKLDRLLPYLGKLAEGKLPVGPVDINLLRIYSFNKYERTRLGLGLQTNEKVFRHGSIGGWFGYGFGDRELKYGGFAEVYLDQFKEFTVRVAYNKDLRDPGRVTLHRDLDHTYLRQWLMYRVDEITGWGLSVKKRLGYLGTELALAEELIRPQYAYSLNSESLSFKQFTAREASLNLRYAFAERTAPAFGKYYSTGCKYPILYAKLVMGQLELEGTQTDYTQVITAVSWQKHINRIGNERFLVKAGKSWSDSPLPLSKLFAGNGYRMDQVAVYAFGGLLTMAPYDYYADEFISGHWRHDFDWKLFRTKSSMPSISLGYNVLWGNMENREAHGLVAFNVPDKAYHETGIILNDILRTRYMGLYYISLHTGYFYHWTKEFDTEKNGKLVIGVGISI